MYAVASLLIEYVMLFSGTQVDYKSRKDELYRSRFIDAIQLSYFYASCNDYSKSTVSLALSTPS